MKKPSSLAQQIQQAQRTVDSWPDTRKSTMYLEGHDVFLTRVSQRQEKHQKIHAGEQKKKVYA